MAVTKTTHPYPLTRVYEQILYYHRAKGGASILFRTGLLEPTYCKTMIAPPLTFNGFYSCKEYTNYSFDSYHFPQWEDNGANATMHMTTSGETRLPRETVRA